MSKRLLLYVLLASTLAFLASLYLTWVEAGRPALGLGINGLLNYFSGDFSFYDGWGVFGQAAALCALAVLAGAGLSLLRPRLVRRWPLASCAGALLFFALLNAAELRGRGHFFAAIDHVHIQLGPGAYLGVGSAALACLAAALLRQDELARRPSVPTVLAGALTLGLLTAFLLPWLRLHIPRVGPATLSGYEVSFRGDDTVVFIAILACFGLPLWGRGTPPGRRLAAAVGTAVLTVGDLSWLGTHVSWPYEAWLELACSLGLVLLALVTGRDLRIGRPSVADAAVVFAASLLVVSLFLPWLKFCGRGVCAPASGWMQTWSATAGGPAVILLVLLLGFQRLFAELAVGAAVYVTATGLEIGPFTQLGYGAPLGFAGAALLLLGSARRLGDVPTDRRRLLARLLPMAACLAFLAIPIAALANRLSPHLQFDAPWRLYWLGAAAILVATRLLGRWLGGPRDDAELLLLPLALLALTALDLTVFGRALGMISWEGWVTVGLCLLLAVLGWLDRKRGLDSFRVPDEIWRVDRLPGAES